MATKKKQPMTSVITLTFGDVAENSHSMEKLGTMADGGFSVDDLRGAAHVFEEQGATVELHNLTTLLPEYVDQRPDAAVLVVRGWLSNADKLLQEQRELTPDTKVYMRGAVKNRIARHNLCFDEESSEANYEEKRGTVVAFRDVSLLEELREKLPTVIGDAAKSLKCEGNYYYDKNKCYIGWHGDAERRKVVGIRLGPYLAETGEVTGETFPLHYRWYLNSEKISDTFTIELGHGDLYIMSEYAVGTNWKLRKTPTLRHAAGTKLPKE